MEKRLTKEVKAFLIIIFGNFMFAAGLNLFIVPLGLYSGGIIGIAQILRTFLVDTLHIQIPGGIDISGIINFGFNIPLFLLAYRSISRKFFVRTLFSVIVQTIFLTILAIPSVPVIDDVLASCLVGGIICGVGIGFTLRSGGSGGGADILGVYFSLRKAGGSVGKLAIAINMVVFSACAIFFEIPVAIYSILYSVVMSLAIDHVHYQNINMTAMIFTKTDGISQQILKEMGRGVTYWQGAGAYTNEDTYILVTVISKYEVTTLKRIIQRMDANAFVIFNEGMSVSGNFEKRL